MIVLTIVVILLAMAMPMMRNLIMNQHVKTGVTDLQTALYFARSEAIKRATDIVVAPVSSDWKNGWTVKAGTTLIRTQGALDSGLSTKTTATTLTYRADGRLTTAPAAPSGTPAGTVAVLYVAGSTTVTPRCVLLDLSGRPSAAMDTDNNGANGCN